MKDWFCQANVITFYEEGSCNLDKGRAMDVVYLYFAKAFDTVPHKRSIHKLRSIVVD